MRIADDHGAELDATFSVEPTLKGADIVLESRGGSNAGPTRARNSDYAPGLEILIRRLADAGAVLLDVLVDSRVARALPSADRRLLPQSEMPLALASLTDIPAFRQRLGRASANVGRPAEGKGGNPTKRLRFVLDWPAAAGRGRDELEARLGRPVSSEATTGADWSEAELRACVAAYHVLWSAEEQGHSANKAALRRRTIAASLPGRSEGSYEFRMQNISSVLEDLGVAFVKGYLPRRNVGKQKPILLRLVNEIWHRDAQLEAATDDLEKLETRIDAARAKLRRSFEGQLPPPPPGAPPPTRMLASATRFPRDPNVIAWVLEAAAGTCEVCGQPAPFLRSNGEPYLEVHHVRELAQGGPDTTDNAVAGCPTCHRRLHHGADRESARRNLLARLPRLKDHPRGRE